MQRHITKTETSNIRHMAYNKFPMKSKSILIKCLHQAAFSPQKQTLLQAIKNIFFTWPGFTARAVKKCLPDSDLTTDKSPMKTQKQGYQSTKEKIKTALEIIKTNRDV